MSNENLGNRLNGLARATATALFEQGELAQLSHSAFEYAAKTVGQSDEPELTLTFPIGYRPDRQAMFGTRQYTKDALAARYGYLALHQLPVNGILQLVTIIEAFLGDVVRAVVTKYPQKIGARRTLTIETVLQAQSLEELHLRAADQLINDLSYKSPTEFAAAMADLISINPLECPAFHRYVELKATRDIVVHNRGVANEIYAKKAGSHARAPSGRALPVDTTYFLESYESCLQLTEWLEAQLHEHWYSSDYEAAKEQLKLPLPLPETGDEGHR